MRNKLLIFCLLIWSITTAQAQQKEFTVSGTVIGVSDKLPIPGVNIVIEGNGTQGRIGTITDFNGKYSLRVQTGQKLTFSSIGYKTKSIVIGTQSKLDIALDVDAQELDEVVVIGYGSVKKSDLTGSVSGLRDEDILKVNPTSVQDALKGRVSGVQILSNDGAPGGGVTMRIRGSNSITAGTSPLFVIDGFPILPDDSDPTANPLADINPNDIQSINVLKDASAVAIYGAQGANGVIVVTTKKGEEGKTKISASANFGIAQMPKKIETLSGEEYAYYAREVAYQKNGQGNPEYTSYFDRIIEDKRFDEATDWVDAITRTAKSRQLNASITGSSGSLKYLLSTGFDEQEGVIDRSKFNRFNARLNLNHKPTKKIDIAGQFSFTNTKHEGMAMNDWEEGNVLNQALFLNPFIPKESAFGSDINNEEGVEVGSNPENPYMFIQNIEKERVKNRFLGNASVTVELLKGLKFRNNLGGQFEKEDTYKFWPTTTRKGDNTGGRIDFNESERYNVYYLSQLTYNKQIGKHNIRAMGGFEAKKIISEKLNTQATRLGDESLGKYAMKTSTEPSTFFNNYQNYSQSSVFGRLNYSFKNRYLLTATYRADGSSKFGENNKWGFFPSLALAWKLKEEDFLKDFDKISQLKVRASIGQSGNDQIQPYSSLATLGDSKYNVLDEVFLGKYSQRLPDANLKWETTTQYDAGVDFGLFNDRISLTFDAYYKKTTDLLMNIKLPATSGFESGQTNYGAFSNKGFDVELTTINIEKGDFRWVTNFNFSVNRTKVLNLPGGEIPFTRNIDHRIKNEVILKEGYPLGVFVGYIQDGIFQNEQDLINAPEYLIGQKALGEVRYVDVNGDGKLDQNDRSPIAYTMPKHTGGISNTITYKGIDLYFLFNWTYGNDIVNGNMKYVTMSRQGYNQLKSLNNTWWSPETPNNDYHKLLAQSHENYFRSEMVEDGSFLRLENVSLGYTLPKKWLKKIGLSQFRIYTSVNNAWIWTKYSWYDPEVNTGWGTAAKVGPGVDVGSYPRARSYKVGLNLSF